MAIETFVDGNPSTPTPKPGTVLNAAFLNSVAEIKQTYANTINALKYNNGVFNATTINLAIAAIGSDTKSLFLQAGNWSINANVNFPDNIRLKMEPGAILVRTGSFTVTLPSRVAIQNGQHFSGSAGFIRFNGRSNLKLYPEHFGSKPDAYTIGTDNTVAMQCCFDAAIEGSRKIRLNGWYRTTGTINATQRSITIDGVAGDACGIVHDPASFINCIEIDTQGEGWFRASNFNVEAMNYRQSKTKYMVYCQNLNEGSKLDIKIQGGVGQLYVGAGYLSDINVRCTNSTWDAVGEAGITQGEWAQVWGDNHAPIHLGSMNACNICLRTLKIGSVVSGGNVGFAPIILESAVGKHSTAMNIEWGLENNDYFTFSGTNYSLRSKHGLYIKSITGILNGLNIEKIRTTETLVKIVGESGFQINAINDYANYCEGDRFLNASAYDIIVDGYHAYDVRNSPGNIFKTTNSGISANQGWIVRQANFAYGRRYRQTVANGGPNDDIENIVDTCEFSGAEKFGGIDDSDRSYGAHRWITPKVLSGYTVTQGLNPVYTPTVGASAGAYVEVTCGVFLRQDGKHVNLKFNTGNGTGNLQRFRLRPITASRFYRVFVGMLGQPYLVEYSSTPDQTPDGNWIAQFDTDPSLAIINLASNPRITTYTGSYTPNSPNVIIRDSAPPTTGYWRAGDFVYNTSATAFSPIGWRCIVGGSPGTWEAVFDLGNTVEWRRSVDGAHYPIVLTNSDQTATSINESVGIRAQLRGGGNSNNREAGTISFRKIGDFNNAADRDSRIVISPAIDEAVTDMVDVSQEGVKITQPLLNGLVQSLRSIATNDDPEEKVYQGRVATVDATVTTILTIPIPSNTITHIRACIQARRTGGSSGTAEDGAAYEIQGAFKNVAGNATLIASTTNFAAEDQVGWNAAFNASSGNVLIQVTGASGNNITWHLTARAYSVST